MGMKAIQAIRWIFLSLLYPTALFADPLDKGEAYTSNPGPPEWIDSVDFGLLLVDYGVFALFIIAIGWSLSRKPHYLQRIESFIWHPFHAIFSAAKRSGPVMEFVLQLLGGLAVFFTVAIWVLICQWFKAQGLGAIAMAGLGFVALLLVRLVKGSGK